MTEVVVDLILSTPDNRFELVLADNSDSPYPWASALNDGRFRYVRRAERCTLTANWEFALSHSRGEWVTVLGNDDGVVPSRLGGYLDTLEIVGVDAVDAVPVNYRWPTAGSPPRMRAYFPRFKGSKTRNYEGVREYFTAFGRTARSAARPIPPLPQIYMLGSIRRSQLDRLPVAEGRRIPSRSPDWYLSVALGDRLDHGLLTTNSPFIHGVSADSAGTIQFGDVSDPRIAADLALDDDRPSTQFRDVPPTPEANWLACWGDYIAACSSFDSPPALQPNQAFHALSSVTRREMWPQLRRFLNAERAPDPPLWAKLYTAGKGRQTRQRLLNAARGLIAVSESQTLTTVARAASLVESLDIAITSAELGRSLHLGRNISCHGVPVRLYGWL